jgi:hypothetical protein
MPFLPNSDREWLESLGWSYEEVVENNPPSKRGVIIRGFLLPQGKFQVDRATLMIQIPQGYPDANLDMFWFEPALYLAPSQRQPNCTITETHFGATWQRWSRHYKAGAWRPGIDDLSTHIDMVVQELKKAS